LVISSVVVLAIIEKSSAVEQIVIFFTWYSMEDKTLNLAAE